MNGNGTDAPAVEILDVDAVKAITTAETDVQVRTAKQFPRDLARSIERCKQLATMDEETAAACLYALPGDGKKIEGGSIRLAEIIAHSWGNLRVQVRIINEGPRFVTSQAAVWDLETNVGISIEKQRRITNRSGQRYKDDMIQTTANAAASIAMRDAVLKIVPKPIWKPIYEACKRKAVGDATTLVERRTSCLGQFAKMGVFEDRLLAAINRETVDEITLDDLAELRGVFQAIRDGEVTVDSAFPAPKPETEEQKPATKAGSVARAAAQAAQKAKPAQPDPEPTEAPPEPENAPSEPEPKAETMTDQRFETIKKLYGNLDTDGKAAIREEFGFGMCSKNEIFKLGPERWTELEGALAVAVAQG